MPHRTKTIDPRKAPQQSRSQDTYSVILQASREVLSRAGLEGFNTNSIAKRAGVSVGSLYQYFPRKEAILTALIREMRASMRDEFKRAIRECKGQGLDASVIALIEASLNHHLDDPKLTQLLEKAEDELPLDEETHALKQDMAGLVVALLQEHQMHNPETSAFDLIALSHGITHAATQAGQNNLEDLSQRLQRAVFGYLRMLR